MLNRGNVDPYTRLTWEWKINLWFRGNTRLQEGISVKLFSSWAAASKLPLVKLTQLESVAFAKLQEGASMKLFSSRPASKLPLVKLTRLESVADLLGSL